MTRPSLAIALSAGTCLTAASALAAPPSLDYVPRGATMVAAVDNVGALGGNLTDLLAMLGLDEAAQNVSMGMMMMGGMGVDPEGSMAIVIMTDDLESLQAGDGAMAVIGEMTDYEAFVGNFGGDPDADIAEFDMQGQTAFARRLSNGFVAFGPHRATVESISARGGGARALGEWSGEVGTEIADDANLVLMADIQAFKPLLEENMDEFYDGLEQGAQMGGDQGALGAEIVRTVVETFLSDARAGLIGLHLDDTGVAIDIAAQFDEDSELGGMFAERGDAGSLMAHLPTVPVLFAGAFDTSHPGVRAIVGNIMALRQEMMPDAPASGALEMFRNADGGAFVIGNSAALLSGGLFSNSAFYMASSNPERFMAANAEGILATNGVEQQGVTMRSQYNEDALEVAGASVDSWSVRMQLDPNNPMAQQAQMAMMGIFGPGGGPQGYIAPVDGGVVGTLSQNRRLMETSINAARAGNGLGESDEIADAASNLRGGNIAELYIGIGNILNTATSVMGMMGQDLDIDVPRDLGSVPVSVGAIDGGVRIRTFVPTDVIVTTSEIAKYVQQLQGGMAPGRGGRDDAGF